MPVREINTSPLFVLSSTAKVRTRVKRVTERGKSLGFTKSMNAHYAQDFYEGDPEKVPGPGFELRWNGACQFLPADWANAIKPSIERVKPPTQIGAYCLSCDKWLYMPGYFAPIFALAEASDHWRVKMNHQIVLLDQHDNLIYRAPYSPLSMSW